MLDDQSCIDKQNNGIVQSSPADPELFLLRHIAVQLINIKMSFNGIDSIKYSIPFRRLPMPVLLQILCKDLFDCIFYILFHPNNRSAVKVIFF